MSCRTYITNLTDNEKTQERLEKYHNEIFARIHDSKLFRQFNGLTFLPNADASGKYSKARALLDTINKEYGVPVVGTSFTKPTGREYAFVNVKHLINREDSSQGVLFQKGNRPSQASEVTLGKFKEFAKRAGLTGEYVDHLEVNGKKISGNGIAKLAEGLYQVVRGKEATAEPEEIAHFAVQALKQDNPALYKEMQKAINSYNVYGETLETYKGIYKNEDGSVDIGKVKDEAMAKLLVDTVIKKSEGTLEKPDNLKRVDGWWNRIKDWFMGLIGKAQFNPFEQAAKETILSAEPQENQLKNLSEEIIKSSKGGFQEGFKTAFQNGDYKGIIKSVAEQLEGPEKLGSTTYQNTIDTLLGGDKQLADKVLELKKNYFLQAEGDLPFEKQEEPTKLDDILTKMRLSVERQIAIYKSKGKQEQLSDLAKLSEQLKTIKETQSVTEFINKAHYLASEASDRIASLRGLEDFSPKMINTIKGVYDYIQSYNILEDIKKLPEFDRIGKEVKADSVMKTLADAIDLRESVKLEYFNQVIPKMSNLLFSAAGPDIKEIVLPGFNEKLTPELIEKELVNMAKDESVWQALLDPLVSSGSPVLGLFARLTNRMIHNQRMRSVEFDIRARVAYKKFLEGTGREGITDNRKRYAGLSELRTIVKNVEDRDENGNKLGTFSKKEFTERYFIEPIDHNKFNKTRTEYMHKINGYLESGKYTKGDYNMLVSKWYQENTERVPNAESIIEEHESTLTRAQFQAWQERNNPSPGVYRYELSRPKESLYKNEAYAELSKNKPLKEFYDWVIKEHTDAQKSLPDGHLLGMRFPAVLKSLGDVAIEDGAAEALKEGKRRFTNWSEADIERGLQNQEGEMVKYLPIHFAQHMDASKVSNDVLENLRKFNYTTNRYEEFSKNLGVAEALKDIMAKNRPFERNVRGEKIVDALAKKIGIEEHIKKPEGTSHAYKHLSDFIDMIYYGEMKAKGAMIKVLGKEIAADKFMDSMGRLTALDMLAGNITQGFNLLTLLNSMRFSEGAGGQFYNLKDWGAAEVQFWKILPGVLGDIGKQTENLSLYGQLIQRYDPIQGGFQHHIFSGESGNKAKRAILTNVAYYSQHVASYTAQVKGMIAMMNHTMVDQTIGGVTNKIKLKDAYELDDNGVLKLKDGVKWTDDDAFNLEQKMHSITRGLHGANDDMSKTSLHKIGAGRLALTFRGWVRPGFKRRFDAIHPDFEKDALVEGNHRAFARVAVQEVRAVRDAVMTGVFRNDKYGKPEWVQWDDLPLMDKQNMMRTVTEIGLILSTALIVAHLAPSKDEDKKNSWMGNFTLYQAKRLQTELLFYTWPLDAWKILKSPTAAMTMIENTLLLANNILPWNIGEEYQTSGRDHKEGELKLWKRLERVIPFINHLENLKHPDQAFQFFKSANL